MHDTTTPAPLPPRSSGKPSRWPSPDPARPMYIRAAGSATAQMVPTRMVYARSQDASAGAGTHRRVVAPSRGLTDRRHSQGRISPCEKGYFGHNVERECPTQTGGTGVDRARSPGEQRHIRHIGPAGIV